MFKNKIYKRILNYCDSNYTELSKEDMIMGNGIFNHRCHLNAVQEVKIGNADEIYLCVTFINGESFIHFINKKDNKYIDNTLGWQYENYEYCIIRKIEDCEYNRINSILNNTKKHLFYSCTNWFERLLSNSEDLL